MQPKYHNRDNFFITLQEAAQLGGLPGKGRSRMLSQAFPAGELSEVCAANDGRGHSCLEKS